MALPLGVPELLPIVCNGRLARMVLRTQVSVLLRPPHRGAEGRQEGGREQHHMGPASPLGRPDPPCCTRMTPATPGRSLAAHTLHAPAPTP